MPPKAAAEASRSMLHALLPDPITGGSIPKGMDSHPRGMTLRQPQARVIAPGMPSMAGRLSRDLRSVETCSRSSQRESDGRQLTLAAGAPSARARGAT